MTEQALIYSKLKSIIRTEQNYIPRNYQTIGGMWTVDTYEYKGVKFQLMDEGYSSRIFSPEVEVLEHWQHDKGTVFEFKRGTDKDLSELLKRLEEQSHDQG